MYRLVLLRHGESIWNRENRFTGWIDVPLSENGEKEAREAVRLLSEAGHRFDVAFTSVLRHAIKTLWIVLEGMDLMWIPVHRSWRINERHYGALQGLNKIETAERLGLDQVRQWRRSYETRPPSLSAEAASHFRQDPRYAELSSEELPLTESLRDTFERFLPYWQETIIPMIRAGRRVLIVAHGNSLRPLVKYLDRISDEDVVGLTIPTGIPLIYELDSNLAPLRRFYLGDPAAVEIAVRAVEEQLRLPHSKE